MKILFTLLIALFTVSAVQAQSADQKYPLILSFESIGTGVPDSKPFDDYILKFKKANKVKSIMAYKLGPMGREGEYHLAFPLTELKGKKRVKFISSMKKIAAQTHERGQVSVMENEPLRAGRPSIANLEKIKY